MGNSAVNCIEGPLNCLRISFAKDCCIISGAIFRMLRIAFGKPCGNTPMIPTL